MIRIKRLYLYIIQTFVPMFLMTFAICLFIVLMQFIWKYIEYMVGKGLSTMVLGELFSYAALGLIPTALPLAILLASLMTFGNLGEKLELLAIKAAGISLLKTMRPLIIFIALVSIGAFFFQNEVMPEINVKLRSLLASIRHKSPELDIPEGSFYSEIKNYNLYVREKDKESGVLYDVKIYDVSKGFDNMAVIISDSAKMRMSSNKDYLLLSLYNGQQFANFQKPGDNTSMRNNKFVPYGRESFKKKDIIIPFDAEFNRMDESALQSTQIAKNITQLRSSVDSISKEVDSMNVIDRKIIINNTYKAVNNSDTLKSFKSIAKIDFDSVMNSLNTTDKTNILSNAISQCEMNRNDFVFRSISKLDATKKIRQHEVELHRKFVLSFACLIFFFIGAPLGAIIRKGGMGMPVVMSVIMFIIYYIIDNVGFKMARDGVLDTWLGAWLSSLVLFPLGVFLTYKAMNDSELFKPETYGKFIRKILFIKSPEKIDKDEKNAIVSSIPNISDLIIDKNILTKLKIADNETLKSIVLNYNLEYDQNTQIAALSILKNKGADLNEIIDRQDYKYYQTNLSYFSSSSIMTIIVYFITLFFFFKNIAGLFSWISIAYIAFYIRSILYYFSFYTYDSSSKKNKVYHPIIAVLSFVGFPLLYPYIKKQIKKELDKIKTIAFSVK